MGISIIRLVAASAIVEISYYGCVAAISGIAVGNEVRVKLVSLVGHATVEISLRLVPNMINGIVVINGQRAVLATPHLTDYGSNGMDEGLTNCSLVVSVIRHHFRQA